MEKKSSYNYQDLIKCANGGLFGSGNAKLPLPPMLMFDRITEISENKGTLKKGLLKAELDIKDELWFKNWSFFTNFYHIISSKMNCSRII